MLTKDSINTAMRAHSHWKTHLKSAIATGESQFTPNIVRVDTECDFGKWLHKLSLQDKSTPEFKEINKLHIEFHKMAALILELALTDKRDEAKAKISIGSEYGLITANLVQALEAWKSKLVS